MPGNVLTGIVRITAPGVEETFRKIGDSLKIVSIGAGKTGLAFTSLQQKVAFFGGGVNRVLPQTVAAIQRLPPAVNAAAAGYSRLTQSSNSATLASINLGRVIQDAPFGFLGIANNLNPLLESFQRLRKESASSGEAFKKLGSSLLGAGGIGLALSIVSSGLILFGDKLFGASKASKLAKEDTERLTEVLKELGGTLDERRQIIIAGTSDETTRVELLSAAVQDQTRSYNERNNALNQLKDINKSYFGDLTLEGDKLSLLRSRVDEYTNAIIAAATVRAFSDDIGKLNVELSKQLIVYNKIGNTLDENKRKLETTSEFYTSLTGEERAGSAAYVNLTRAIKNGTKELEKQGAVISDLAGKSTDFKGALKRALDESLKFKPLSEVALKVTPKVKVDDFVIPLPELRIQPREEPTVDFKKIKLVLSGDQLRTFAEEVDQRINNEIEKLVIDPKFKVSGLLSLEDIKLVESNASRLFGGLGAGFAEVFAAQFNKSVGENLLKGVDIGSSMDEAFAGLFIGAEAIKAITSNFNGLVDSIFDGKNAFQSFGDFAKGILKDLLKQIIKTAIAAAILSLISGGGKAGLSFIGALRSLAGGRAKGGPVTAGESYLVGEKGPEIFRPKQSGFIIPNNKINGVTPNTGQRIQGQDNYTGRGVSQGGITVKILGEFVQRGQDMIATIALAQQSNNRLT